MPYLWTRRQQPSFFSITKFQEPKQIPSINPHPDIIEKFMDGGSLINNNPKHKSKNDIPEEKPKKKKKRLPGEKLLKKLAKHKDSDEDEKKFKRIIYAIKSNIDKVYKAEELPFE